MASWHADFLIGEWRVSPKLSNVYKDGQTVSVKRKPMAVLVCLADANGEVVSRDDIMDQVWPGMAVTDDVLTQSIVELRKVFDDDAKQPRIIETIPRVGFRLVAAVAPAAGTADTDGPGSARRYRLAAMVLVVVGTGLWVLLARHEAPRNPVIQVTERPSIAVLPFENMSPDPEQEYFSDGLAEEILVVLARIPGLAVASRTSAFAYKGNDRNMSLIAEELRVDYVLEGSVRTAEDRVRITVKLIDTRDDVQLWSDIFEREIDDVFLIQEETAKAIGGALDIRLADARGNVISVSGTNDVGAHNAYLKGRYLFHKRGHENVRQAIEYFQQATALDPDFAEAHASLALAKTIGWGQLDPEGASVSAKRALDRDRSLPMAWIAAGAAAKRQYRFDESEQALREALALEPRNAEAAHFLADLLYQQGRLEEALQVALRAVSLDPTAAIKRVSLGNYHMALGQVAEGMAHLDAAMEIDTAVYPYPLVWKAVTGDTEGALAILARVRTDNEVSVLDDAYYRGFILVTAGRIEEARTVVAGLEKEREDFIVPDVPVFVLTYLGDIDEANRMMEARFIKGDLFPEFRYFARFLPDFPLRETRYHELRASVGLPDHDDD